MSGRTEDAVSMASGVRPGREGGKGRCRKAHSVRQYTPGNHMLIYCKYCIILFVDNDILLI